MNLENIKNNAIAVSSVALILLLPLAVIVGTKMLLNIQYPHIEAAFKNQRFEYLKARDNASRQYHFYSYLIFGILFLILGIFVISVLPLSMAFTLAGILCLILLCENYWSRLGDAFQFLSLIVAILILIITSFKLVERK